MAGGQAWEHCGLGWLLGGGTALPGDHGCPPGPGWPQCRGSGCGRGLCLDTHLFLQVLGLAGRVLAHTQHLYAASRHLFQPGHGYQQVPGWEGEYGEKAWGHGVPAPGSPPGPAHPILQEEEAGPWYDMSAQEIQPLYPERKGKLSTSCCLQDAWSGGSSLRVQGTIPAGEERVSIR